MVVSMNNTYIIANFIGKYKKKYRCYEQMEMNDYLCLNFEYIIYERDSRSKPYSAILRHDWSNDTTSVNWCG